MALVSRLTEQLVPHNQGGMKATQKYDDIGLGVADKKKKLEGKSSTLRNSFLQITV